MRELIGRLILGGFVMESYTYLGAPAWAAVMGATIVAYLAFPVKVTA